MMRLLNLVVIAACLLALPAPVGAEDTRVVQVTQVDNSQYPDVTIYVSVTDAGGNVVGGLQQSEFKVTEDGTPVQITSFKGGEQVALATALVIDRSGSMADENKLIGAQQAASTFVDLMRSQDQAALVSFSDSVRVDQSFTSDKTALKNMIGVLTAGGGTAWYDGVIDAVGLFGKSVSGRRAIILLSDGLDNQSSHALEEAIAAARTAGIPIFTIGLGNQPSGSDVLSQLLSGSGGYDEASLKRAADETGGKFYHAPTAAELKGLYESLAMSMQHDYAITYRSPRPTYDGTRRNIVVTVGAATGGTQYLEQHLLNIHSEPVIGLVLFLPLLAVLVLPLVFRTRRTPAASPSPAMVQVDVPQPSARTSPVAPSSITPPQPYQPVSTSLTAPAMKVCVKCGAPLRPEAKFCAKCGATQAPVTPAAQQQNCRRCGAALKPGAKFCNHCGSRQL